MELYIIRAVIQFEVKYNEQTLLSKFKPSLNSTLQVVLSITDDLKVIENLNKGITLRVKDENNKFTTTFDSINETGNFLGVPITTLKRYINLINYLIFSPTLNKKVFIFDGTKPLTKDKPNFPKTTTYNDITGIDLYSLEKGFLYAFFVDKVTILGKFSSPGEAAKILDNKKESRYIRRYINLDRLVLVGPDRTAVYFVMHPDWFKNIKDRGKIRILAVKSLNHKSIVLLDTDNNESVLFSTVGDLLGYLNLNIKNTTFVKKYMRDLDGELAKKYLNKYEFIYAKIYKGIITKDLRRKET